MFAGAEAETYGAKIRARAPGYEVMHAVIAASLAATLPDDARLLVVGAGGGEDLLALSAAAPGWSFVAVDPEPSMIAVARRRLAGAEDRISFHAGYVADLPPDAGFDAAVAILVSHFLPDDGPKLAFFKAIGARLAPRGLLASADLMAGLSAPPPYRAWLAQAGLDAAMLAKVERRMAHEFHPINEARLAELLTEAGMAPPQRIYQALAYGAYVTQRAAQSGR